MVRFIYGPTPHHWPMGTYAEVIILHIIMMGATGTDEKEVSVSKTLDPGRDFLSGL